MKRVATYSASGPFAGQVRQLRHIEGAQRWRVKLVTQREGGQEDIHVIEPAQRVALGDLYPIVQQSIDELCQPGEKLKAARMEFCIL